MMAKANLTLLRSGPQTCVVDQGRIGYQDIGISPGGAADLQAFYWANRLLSNRANEACLEIAIGGASIQFEKACSIAVCGADTPLKILSSKNSAAVNADTWQTIQIADGDTLQINPARSGLRAYLAVKGGLIVNKELGSASSSVKQLLGPFDGRWLKNNDRISYHDKPQIEYNISASSAILQTPYRFIPNYLEPLNLALIPSYQFQQFSNQDIALLCQQTYKVSDLSDRMGVRLTGQAFKHVPNNIESEAIALGAVQVPANGLPIILSVDRQTIGGYSKLGCVSRLSLYQLNQRRPNQTVKFYLSSWEVEHEKWSAFQQFFS
ncbi:biotin-dependent carboxyltransferase family protein [Agarivorans sp. TSD2052]|uniref:5-oxoprolinase subunit C family protein n=1 Tax=Agarivorans sp. TSD2052 TaxID=2937286 RepID=UPI00200BC624|nr:biotin-dependent carboxyltransferase family protein [Agarivorans sp. TSD2052]UPW20637.1 biotin-dependent carboxyltransferase family protein [Agarivorans sp. TSD2052]